MLDLNEMQFELLPNVNASAGAGFGIDLDVEVDDAGFDPGSDDWVTQDGASSTRGTTTFGRDQLTGPMWSWTMHVNAQDVPSALAALSRIRTAWRRGRELEPGEVMPLRYRIGDRVRRVYGRSRNFAAPPDNKILSGYVPVTSSFKCVDEYTYDDVESSQVILSASTPPGGTGFVFPVVFPASTLGAEANQIPPGVLAVGGDAAVNPVIRFDGPLVRPWLQAEGWRVDLDVTLATGEYAVIDTRAWALSVLKNGTEGIGGKLGRRQWLEDIFLEPGNHDLQFGAASASGSASCTVSWRNAWNSI